MAVAGLVATMADRHFLPGAQLGASLVLLVVDVRVNARRSEGNVTSAGATVAGLLPSSNYQDGVRRRAARANFVLIRNNKLVAVWGVPPFARLPNRNATRYTASSDYRAIWGCNAGSFRWWQSASQHHNQRSRRVYDILRLLRHFCLAQEESCLEGCEDGTLAGRIHILHSWHGRGLWLLVTERVHFAVRCCGWCRSVRRAC